MSIRIGLRYVGRFCTHWILVDQVEKRKLLNAPVFIEQNRFFKLTHADVRIDGAFVTCELRPRFLFDDLW